jgi:hypothetical protein
MMVIEENVRGVCSVCLEGMRDTVCFCQARISNVFLGSGFCLHMNIHVDGQFMELSSDYSAWRGMIWRPLINYW